MRGDATHDREDECRVEGSVDREELLVVITDPHVRLWLPESGRRKLCASVSFTRASVAFGFKHTLENLIENALGSASCRDHVLRIGKTTVGIISHLP